MSRNLGRLFRLVVDVQHCWLEHTAPPADPEHNATEPEPENTEIRENTHCVSKYLAAKFGFF